MMERRRQEIWARWEAVQTPVVQGLKMPPMADHEVFLDNADDDIEYLLAELERLSKIERAVKKFLRREDRALLNVQLEDAIEQLRKSVEEAG